MNIIVDLLLFAALLLLVIQRSRTLLTYFQQEEYNGKRFLVSWLAVRLFDVKASVAAVAAVGLVGVGANASLVTIFLAASILVFSYIERRHHYKKPLVMTQRATRIYRLTLTVLILLSLSVFVHPLFVILPLQIAPMALVVVDQALGPLQTRINRRFENEARSKLERLAPVRIGVTGSFGKTTVKYMLAEILSASAPVYFSRGSINTVLGHSRHIRQRLQWAHKYFVAEMGAYGIGSIKRLCDFIHPQYGIVTAVGDAHTERFGSLEAVAQAKSELAEAVCTTGGIVVLNQSLLHYEPFRLLRERYATHVVTVGAIGADVEVKSEGNADGSWTIQLNSDDPRIPSITYDLPLLGDHNVLNSALAVVLALIVDSSIADQLPYFTRTISQVPHRLQKVGSPGSALILDDAYNSNELGFISAVSTTKKLAVQRNGRSILVTPGIAELGLEHDRVHERLGKYCAENCDLIYVINRSRIESFYQSAIGAKAKVVCVPTFAAARDALSREINENDVVLYENDLPDLLEEKRLL